MRLNTLFAPNTNLCVTFTVWLSLLFLSACTTPGFRAPVEERGASASVNGQSAVTASSPTAAHNLAPQPSGSHSSPVNGLAPKSQVQATPIPLDSNTSSIRPISSPDTLDRAGYYTVKPGETLYRVGLETGQSWQDIARWNNIDSSNKIEAGQVLRVAPPPAQTVIAPSIKGESRAISNDAKDTKSQVSLDSGAAQPLAAAPHTTQNQPNASHQDDNIDWLWPSDGAVLSIFDEGKSKGITLGGKLGDNVLAAAEGRVVYAGSGLRGYGNLIILKHNSSYLTAYAHNQSLLVKEDQTVKRGQKIAEMGSSDAERIQLHFEIRKQGKPVDPLKILPPR